MRLLTTALALSTLCSTGCADRAGRLVPLTPDPAPAAACPAAFPAPPVLTPLAPFRLADGREAVLLDTVIARETLTARYIIVGRDAWYQCRSAVTYGEDWRRAVLGGRR